MTRLILFKRLYQTHIHPQLFRQMVQLTDGSTVRIVSVCNSRPFVKVGVDALSHPSWNPHLRSKMLLSEHGEVARFKERFSQMDDVTLAGFDGLLPDRTRDPVISSPADKKKVTKTKK